MRNRPLVYLHGWGGSKTSMQPLADVLSEHASKIFIPDLPGFGQAEILEHPWDADDYVRWVHGRLVEKNIDRATIIGHSFGGHIACRFAATYPTMVDQLILLAPSGIRRPLTGRQRFAQGMVRLWRRFPIPAIPGVRSLLYFLAGERDYFRASPLMRQTMQKVLAQDVRDVLSKIKCETLIVWGMEDRMTPVENAEIFKKGIKHAKLVTIDGARHGIPFTHTTEVLEQAERFLKERNDT